jgi:hypothetical protein
MHQSEKKASSKRKLRKEWSHDVPMLALPKNRPAFVEDDGGGGFWICDAVGARDWRMLYVRCILLVGCIYLEEENCVCSKIKNLRVVFASARGREVGFCYVVWVRKHGDVFGGRSRRTGSSRLRQTPHIIWAPLLKEAQI